MSYRRRYWAPFTITGTEIGSGIITEPKLATGAVSSRAVLDRAIVADDIADAAIRARHLGPDIPSIGVIPDNSITTPKIVNDAVTALKIAAGAINTPSQLADAVVETDKLKDGSVTSVKIADGAVDAGDIAPLSITTEKLVNAAVTPEKIKDDAVETDKIKNYNVTEPKLANASVTTVKIATDAVETLKIKDLNVTPAKASLGFGRYVPRAPNVPDFDDGDLTWDSAYHVNGLDLSGIVPTGAVAVALAIRISEETSGDVVILCTDSVTKAVSAMEVYAPTGMGIGDEGYVFAILALDADRKLDYFAGKGGANTPATGIAVLGYII